MQQRTHASSGSVSAQLMARGASRLPVARLPLASLAVALVVGFARPGIAADNYRKLKDVEIKAKLAGMETTDQVHWTEHFMRDGTYRVWAMGKPRVGKWRTDKGKLCVDDGTPNPEECEEVWLSGNKIQFRLDDGFVAREGVLQSQRPRQ
jgi:hypothetical protein